jgi:thiamine pyrophosphokinase
MNKTALIVAGGKAPSKNLLFQYIEKSDFIIGADKGGESLMDDDISTFAVVGDFDSIDESVLDWFKSKETLVLKSKTEKDETDTMIAINLAINNGAKTIYILGALGQRLDHQVANLALLLYTDKRKTRSYIIDEDNIAFIALREETIKTKKGDNISVFAVSKSAKFKSADGLKYSLDGLTIKRNNPVGVSNISLKNCIKLSIKKGKVLVIKSSE